MEAPDFRSVALGDMAQSRASVVQQALHEPRRFLQGKPLKEIVSFMLVLLTEGRGGAVGKPHLGTVGNSEAHVENFSCDLVMQMDMP
jgi:hypothetical protein